jgi:hypothetical protein
MLTTSKCHNKKNEDTLNNNLFDSYCYKHLKFETAVESVNDLGILFFDEPVGDA